MPRWSESEERAVIDLYKSLLVRERQGMLIDIGQEARWIPGVNKPATSVRMRMQNMSAVLEEMGLPRLKAVTPLANYAAQTKRLVASTSW